VIIFLGVAILGVLLIVAAVALARFAAPLQRRQRVVLLVVVALAALYVVPKMIEGGLEGYRMGADFGRNHVR
jgi:hypothetical protein